MPTLTPIWNSPPQFEGSDGKPLVGGTLYFYDSGTTNAQTVYNSAGTDIGTSLTLDSLGYPSYSNNVVAPFRDVSKGLKIKLEDAAAAEVWTIDLIPQPEDTLFSEQTLVDATSIDWDVSLGSGKVTLAGNRTMNAPTNQVAGRVYTLRVIQDGTGSRTITWNSVFKWTGTTAPTLSTGAGDVDVLAFVSDGTSMWEVSRSLNTG